MVFALFSIFLARDYVAMITSWNVYLWDATLESFVYLRYSIVAKSEGYSIATSV